VSYIATTSSILWQGCRPVFVDIHPETLNIDPLKIEAAVTSETSAILATHVYGNPCDITAIQQIADRYHLKVIYDAAHCFGTKYKGRSVFAYGDISATSFHATKLFHTVEGGAVFTSDPDLYRKMDFMRNFGHNGPDNFAELGINGKNSEFHAAMGLCNLNYIHELLESRKRQWLFYQELLRGNGVQLLSLEKDTEFNYAYFPVIFPAEEDLLNAVSVLNKEGISPRRYFYPVLNTLDYVTYTCCPVAESIAKRVLCLPLFYGLDKEDQLKITQSVLLEAKQII
jgi:dTDP-4-amino-4,6-dideoxygalactose transaminase